MRDHPVRARFVEARSWVAERRLASTVLGGMMVTSLLLWGALLVGTGGDRPSGVSASGRVGGSAVPSESDAASPGVQPPATAAAPDGPAGAAEPGDGERSRDRPVTDGQADDEEEPGDEPTSTVSLDLDGRCEVEVAATEADDPIVRQAWRHPECELAPLDPTHPDERWIVILASFSGEGAARQELDAGGGRGHGPDLLWSSHYPSLRPELWVVFEGPFRDRATAAARAEQLGSGAYPRFLRPLPPPDEVPPAG